MELGGAGVDKMQGWGDGHGLRVARDVVSALGQVLSSTLAFCSVCRKGGKGTWIMKQLESELKWSFVVLGK